jgi:hypothetical protein
LCWKTWTGIAGKPEVVLLENLDLLSWKTWIGIAGKLDLLSWTT